MSAPTILHALAQRLAEAMGPDRELDRDLHVALGLSMDTTVHCGVLLNAYTASLDAAVALVERVLPGWWQSSGLCSLTGHASIGPDYNGPDADRLRREWPEERFHEGFHADLKPGDGRHRQCFALLHCLLQAEIARAG